MIATHIRPLLVILSISTAIGVLMHDSRIDKATMVALTMPFAISGVDASHGKFTDLSGASHTHAERASLSQLVRDLRGHSPRIQPRDSGKHTLSKRAVRGHHAFDNYYLPVV